MNDFLPKEYSVPSSTDKYYKFENGENQFRIMSSPIMGHEYWKTVEGRRKPVRVKMGVGISTDDLEVNPKSGEVDLPKHFWALVIWDYKSEKAKVLEITQKGIQKSLTALAKDPDWGSPVGTNGYDIVVTKSGEGKETDYQTQPKPHKKLVDGIEQLVKDMNINLEALFKGDDPFVPSDGSEIFIDDKELEKANKA